MRRADAAKMWPMTEQISPDAADTRIPVTIVMGAKGSGKTTWLMRQLREPGCADSLLVLDPASGVGLTHPLVAYVREAAVVDTGCLCCSLRQDLVRTLVNAVWRYSRNGQRQYARVFIEASADASPSALAATIADLPAVSRRYRLAQIVTLVNAQADLPAWASAAPAAEQLQQAHCLLLSKTDALEPRQLQILQQRLRLWNPDAPMLPATTVYSCRHDCIPNFC